MFGTGASGANQQNDCVFYQNVHVGEEDVYFSRCAVFLATFCTVTVTPHLSSDVPL